jgi:hypothetical protein
MRSVLLPAIAMSLICAANRASATPRFEVTFDAKSSTAPLDGRLLLIISNDPSDEPRMQVDDSARTQQLFGIDVDGWKLGERQVIDAQVLGYPRDSLRDVPAGKFRVQAVLHRYETFHRKDGHTVKLPMDRGEGQQWNRAPGNLYSTPLEVSYDPRADTAIRIALDKTIPPIVPPNNTRYVRHERIQSKLLSEFWGRPMYLGAHVLVPEGFDAHPNARYPFIIAHGHFPDDFGRFREAPPDPNLKPDYSERFHWKGYNRTQQEEAHRFFKLWTGQFPRVLIVEIQHANPFYDDSYAVDSANVGLYGQAIQTELIPYLEKKYRALGTGWSRFVYGGSTGGWEAMAVQVLYPDFYNGAYIACPDPIDFRAYAVTDLYKDRNAFYLDSYWKRTPRPAIRDALGRTVTTIEEASRRELVLGTRGRSGEQWDIWQAVFSPTGPDGYPASIWDKRTGVIDHAVAEYWKHYDLTDILRRDWERGLGEKLRGKLHIYVGTMDTYFLDGSVHLAEEFLANTKNPPYDGEIVYGAGFEHCWSGDPSLPNALSRLRFHERFVPKIVERIRKTAPPGADLSSWRY